MLSCVSPAASVASVFPTTFGHVFLASSLRAECPAYAIFLDLLTLLIRSEEYKLTYKSRNKHSRRKRLFPCTTRKKVDNLAELYLKGYTDLYKGISNDKSQTRLRKTKRVHGHWKTGPLQGIDMVSETCAATSN